MIKLAILTCKEIDVNACNDDNLIIPLLQKQNVEAVFEVWDEPSVSWHSYDCILIRSTWDYTQKIEQFISFLKSLPQNIKLFNSKEVVFGNYDKSYLFKLEDKGFEIVPSIKEVINHQSIEFLFKELASQKLVVKPLIGASASGVQVVDENSISKLKPSSAPHLIQPFQDSISSSGEVSLIYFNNIFSHAILKLPREGEYRSQEEFGSRITPFFPDKETIYYALDVLKFLSKETLFARVDLLINPQGLWRYIGEVELIEPALYLSFDESAPARFVDAICKRIKNE